MKRTKWTGFLRTLLFGSAVTGCTGQAGQAPGFDEAVANDQPLLIDDSNLWIDPNISVCWTNLASSTAEQRTWVQQAIIREFESISDLRFTGWDKQCSAVPGEIAINVSNNNWPQAEIGERAASTTPNMWLNFFGVAPRDLDSDGQLDFVGCNDDSRGAYFGFTGREWVSNKHSCIDVIAVHEFAHVLGIGHEQDRTDTPATCGAPGTSSYLHYGYWDESSISNYCNPIWNNDGRLSVLDVAGIQEYYGAPGNDNLWLSLGNLSDYADTTTDLMTFSVRPHTISATDYKPLSGDFNGDGIDDIFWYRPAGSDSLWLFDSNGGHTSISKSANGTYQPMVGDFNGDGRSDIFWYRPGTESDAIWYFNADGSHTSRAEEANGTYTAFAGDFNGDGRSDIFWYRPGTSSDAIWFFNADKTHSSRTETINATDYQPFAGDFDGDGVDDVFWYRPGASSDAIWFFATNKSHTSVAVTANGTYQPKVGDYDGDSRADILWFRAGTGNDAFWLGTGTRGSFVSTPTRYDGGGVALSGDFNGDLLDDIFFYQ